MKGGTFRNTQWDPTLLTSQIVSMQFCVYFTLGLLVFVANKLSGDNYSLDHLFEYHVIKPRINFHTIFMALFYRKFTSMIWEEGWLYAPLC